MNEDSDVGFLKGDLDRMSTEVLEGQLEKYQDWLGQLEQMDARYLDEKQVIAKRQFKAKVRDLQARLDEVRAKDGESRK